MSGARHAHVAVTASAVAEVADLLGDFCAAESLSEDVIWPLRVALDEIVANIVAYGVTAPGRSSFDVWLERTGPFVEITVADDGPAFDPLAQPAPDVNLPLEARRPGGLGIMLVKSLMDEVRYQRTSRNVLTVRKRVDAGDSPTEAGIDEDRAGD